MTQTFQLDPVNGRKSFYGKCKVEDDGKVARLTSYATVVAAYDHEANKMVVYGWYSGTTASHINAFLVHFGYDTTNKRGMDEWEANTSQS